MASLTETENVSRKIVVKEKDYLTPAEVARLLMVSPVTVRQWAQKGALKSKATLGGHRRFSLQDIQEFARSRGLKLVNESKESIRILIVDDDVQVSKMLSELLDLLPYVIETLTAIDGFEAGSKVQSFQPDIVLMDLMMPGMNGFETCRRLKQDPATKGIRVVAMTGYPSPENVEKIIQTGAEACLVKPIVRNQLIDALGFDLLENYPKASQA